MLQRDWPIRTRSSLTEDNLAKRITMLMGSGASGASQPAVMAQLEESFLQCFERLARGKKEFDEAYWSALQDLQKKLFASS